MGAPRFSIPCATMFRRECAPGPQVSPRRRSISRPPRFSTSASPVRPAEATPTEMRDALASDKCESAGARSAGQARRAIASLARASTMAVGLASAIEARSGETRASVRGSMAKPRERGRLSGDTQTTLHDIGPCTFDVIASKSERDRHSDLVASPCVCCNLGVRMAGG